MLKADVLEVRVLDLDRFLALIFGIGFSDRALEVRGVVQEDGNLCVANSLETAVVDEALTEGAAQELRVFNQDISATIFSKVGQEAIIYTGIRDRALVTQIVRFNLNESI